MISIFYMDIRAIGWSGILQITAFAGASFYSFGPGLGKRGRRGIFGLRAASAGAVGPFGAVRMAGERADIRLRQVWLLRLWFAVKPSQCGRAGCRSALDQIASTAFDFLPIVARAVLPWAATCRYQSAMQC
jgi:hypothetical protein